MVPGSFHDFLLGSAGASAALMGLLFVAVSIAPERVFGREAVAERRTEASSAFTALINAFFVSLGGLIPGINLGVLAAIMGAVALVQTLSLLRLWVRWRLERRVIHGAVLFLVSTAVYGYEIWTAWPLLSGASDTGALTSVMGLLLGTYAIALSRAWELLGGSERSRIEGQIVAEGAIPAESEHREAPATDGGQFMVDRAMPGAPELDGESAAPWRESMPVGHAHE